MSATEAPTPVHLEGTPQLDADHVGEQFDQQVEQQVEETLEEHQLSSTDVQDGDFDRENAEICSEVEAQATESLDQESNADATADGGSEVSEESDEGFGPEVNTPILLNPESTQSSGDQPSRAETAQLPVESLSPKKEDITSAYAAAPSEVAIESKDSGFGATGKPSAPAFPAGLSPAPKPSNTEHELRRFGLSTQDKVLESFSCALYPKKGLLTHGRIFITQHFIAFAGWKDMRVLLAMRGVVKIEKTNTLMYIPNALTITMEDKSEYFFGSFIDRDACVQMLKNLVEIERRILEIHGDDSGIASRGLEFGYQTRQPVVRAPSAGLSFQNFLMGSEKPAAATTGSTVSPPPPVVSTCSDEPNGGHGASVIGNSPTDPLEDSAELSPVESRKEDLAVRASVELTAPLDSPSIAPNTSSVAAVFVPVENAPSCLAPSEVQASATESTISVKEQPQKKAERSLSSVRADLSTLAKSSAVQWLWKEDVQCPCQQLWTPCWLYACGYGDFLRDEGALDLKYTEWTPFRGVVEEDVHSKLKFSFSRTFTYAFPRTTMLMFGPKFAPIQQTQYLFVPDDVPTFEQLEIVQPQQAVVLFITKFEGIPMADVFKVMQFWVIDHNSSAAPAPANAELGRAAVFLQVGVAIHYVKSSMFKSQILSGTKDEVSGQIKKYVLYAQLRAAEYKRALDQDGAQVLQSDDAVVEAARKRYSGTFQSMRPVDAATQEPASGAAQARPVALPTVVVPPAAERTVIDMTPIHVAIGLAALCLVILLSLFQSQRRIASLDSKIDDLTVALMETRSLVKALVERGAACAAPA